MAFTANHIPVADTNRFSSLVVDYIAGKEDLKAFFNHAPDVEGIAAAITEREKFPSDRKLLSSQLKQQYSGVKNEPDLQRNLDLLSQANTFSVCTAHQPNIFTGHLYFIYKILHAISLAKYLTGVFADKNFVPVFYMGSEDADLAELGSVEIDGKRYTWNTDQKGAVGRMKVDNALLKLVEEISGQVSVLPYGKEIIDLLTSCYKLGRSIEESTFQLLNEMFGKFGLVVLLPDNKDFKGSFESILHKELREGFSAKALHRTVSKFPSKYKVQADGRQINLFYLQDQSRERIERSGSGFAVNNTELYFTEDEFAVVLKDEPQRFSPNVILRPLYQEWILPNVAFIGGGGELAYWLELKEVFESAGIPMPALVLRNSFLIIEKKWAQKIEQWNFSGTDIFRDKQELINRLVTALSANRLELGEEKAQLDDVLKNISSLAIKQDKTLEKHVGSIRQLMNLRLTALEKKMLRAARNREEVVVNQVSNFHASLFPNGQLQERVANIIPFYARYGPQFIEVLLQHSRNLEQDFTILSEV